MASFACDRCNREFEADEPRCPKCLRRTSVRTLGSEKEAAALAAKEEEATWRPGLFVALLGLSLVISLSLLAVYLGSIDTLALLQAEVPAAVGLALGSIVSLRMAPRFAVEDAHPLLTYLRWLGVAALVGTSVTVAGVLAALMVADVSPFLAVLLGIALWLGVALPAFKFGLDRTVARERAPGASGTGKWR